MCRVHRPRLQFKANQRELSNRAVPPLLVVLTGEHFGSRQGTGRLA